MYLNYFTRHGTFRVWGIMQSILIVLFLSCEYNDSRKQPSIAYTHAQAQSIRRTCKPDTFTAAFYNLENCFDLEYDGTEYPEYIPGKSSWTREIQLVKINLMAEVIAGMDADILGVCEIEDEDALNDLIEGLKRFKVNYPYHVIGKAERRTVTCPALLSRFPVTSFQTHNIDLPGNSITREILEADVQVCDRSLKVFVNHWPSRQHPESQRLDAARVLVSRLNSCSPGTEYILLGDFNADFNEFQTFSAAKLNNTGGKTGLNHLLKTLITDSSKIQYVTEENINAAGAGAHYDLWLELPEMQRMSSVYKSNRQTPDHILIPAVLFDSTGISYLDNSFNAFTWDGRLLKDGKPFRWEIKWVKKHKLHLGKGYSDHLPVIARFTNMPFVKLERSSVPEPGSLSVQQGSGGSDGSGASGSFEHSTEGWIACVNGVSIQRDSLSNASGRYSLKISGAGMKSNSTIAKTVLTQEKGTRSVRLSVKGSGKISFRLRCDGGEWIYFNGPHFTASGSARYIESSFDSWKQIKCTHDVLSSGELEFEIRAAKETPFAIWIDNVT
jgi:hypothetical protein